MVHDLYFLIDVMVLCMCVCVLLRFGGKIYVLYQKRDDIGFLVPISCVMYMASILLGYLENESLN